MIQVDNRLIAAAMEDDEATLRSEWPQPLAEDAFHGVAGDFVRAIEPHTEADPAALLIQWLVAFGCLIGRTVHFRAEADRHFARLFACLVGQTSRGRKGTSQGYIDSRIETIDPAWRDERVLNGLSTGEGLIWAVRDPVTNDKGEVIDVGQEDKRLLVIEPEFARVLGACERADNSLSAVLRQAWDDTTLRILTKKQAAAAHNAHIALIAHITRDELRRLLTETAACNGFANRFLWGCCRRSKLLPEGGKPSAAALAEVDARLKEVVRWASCEPRELPRDRAARDAWIDIYGSLTASKPGMLGAVTARSEAQTMRLALIYAALDCSEVIRLEHLLAGLAVWQYCEQSAAYIFGDSIGDKVADEIHHALKLAGPAGLTRADVREHFGRHKTSEQIGRALAVLSELGMATRRTETTAGRPAERWFAMGAR